MPDLAYMDVDLHCPHCNEITINTVSFQWGYCPARVPIESYIYHIGDSIIWRKCLDGTIPSWVWFEGDIPSIGGGNMGDPAYRDLLLTDQLWRLPWSCQLCDQPLQGTVVEVRNGVIVDARIYLSDEFTDDCQIYLIDTNDNYKSIPEWNDLRIDTVVCLPLMVWNTIDYLP